MPEEKETKKYTTISIPTPLANKIKQRIEGTGFNSLSSYVTYVLREVISNVEDDEQQEAFSKDDEEKVKDRLRALGYLD
ncbi:MAG TPA: CopG family transcriptional regulator [Candidatus Thermoplasmatota archaeon]|nr:CopG family transcriptional regulator [Candidatus Thermoplasmatota archaeon]